MDLVNSALDLISKFLGILVVVGGIFVGGSKVLSWKRRTEEAHERISTEIGQREKHEDKCAEKYQHLDKSMSDMHEKVNDVAKTVARIEGILSERRQ